MRSWTVCRPKIPDNAITTTSLPFDGRDAGPCGPRWREIYAWCSVQKTALLPMIPSRRGVSRHVRVVSGCLVLEWQHEPRPAGASSLAWMVVPIKTSGGRVAIRAGDRRDKVRCADRHPGDGRSSGDMDFKVAGTSRASPPCRWISRSAAPWTL